MNRSGEIENTAAVLTWILRTGVAMCFIGHGAFGLITKAGWVPYFSVVGIPEAWAWKLMPWIGGMDIAIGFLAFVWPCRALFIWSATWAAWTAMLRPLAGQGWPEFFERAGNYGVPLALLLAIGWRGPLFARMTEQGFELSAQTTARLIRFLRASLVVLLAGHALCGVWLQKAALAHHYEILGVADPARTMLAVGWFELALAAAVALFRHPALMIGIALWKLATESLFFTSGAMAPGFELIERGGSYIIPLALAYLLSRPPAGEREPSRLQSA